MTSWCRACGRWRRVPLKQRAGFARGTFSGAAAAKAHTSRDRDPGRACVRRHRFDQDRIPMATTSGMPPKALGRADVRVSALPKAPWGHSDCLETGTGARRERDRGGGSGTERGRGRCGSGAAVLGMARHEAGFSASKGLFANAPLALHHNVLASAGGPHPTPTSKIRRREKTHLPRPRSVPPAHLTLISSPVPLS